MKNLLKLLLLAAYFITTYAKQPNIILIVTDDQDIVLNGMTPLTKTRNLIANQGTTFTNAFCTTPICCPSRSTILTGLYTHSHKAYNNSLTGGCSSADWQSRLEPRTFGKFVHDSGYYTFYAGKYLNEYGYPKAGGTEHVPPGWDWWVGLVGNSVYYNYSLSVNGTRHKHGDAPEDYLTDVVKKYSLDFLRQNHIIRNDRAFLMAIHPPSAHGPFTPSEKYRGYYNGTKAVRTPNFDKPGEGKHWLLRLQPGPSTTECIDRVDEVFKDRWETLLSVDDLVEDIVLQLEATNLINDTYIIFTSDHGFHLGQFGQFWDKRQPYDTDIRIPFFIRGPGVPKKALKNDPVLTIDIAPTILDIAGITPPVEMDGTSFLPKINASDVVFNRSFLIEYHGESSEEHNDLEGCYNDLNLKYCIPECSCKCQDVKNNTFTCIRQVSNEKNELFCRFEDEENFTEYYDLSEDPYEMNNLSKYVKRHAQYEKILDCLKNQLPSEEHNVFNKCAE